jgi:hypothetical protein
MDRGSEIMPLEIFMKYDFSGFRAVGRMGSTKNEKRYIPL